MSYLNSYTHTVFLLIFFVYKRNRDHKQALIFSVAPEDDIRENYVNYDEEGGGEEDETGYNLPTISIPLVETPSNKSSIRSDNPLIRPEEQEPVQKAAPMPIVNDRPKSSSKLPKIPQLSNFYKTGPRDTPALAFRLFLRHNVSTPQGALFSGCNSSFSV